MRVKICGIQHVEHALIAVGTGADFVGLILAPSPRRVSPRIAADIVAAVHAHTRRGPGASVVGVFVNAGAGEINRIARSCELDYVQLSGNEAADLPLALELPAIQVIHVGPEDTKASLLPKVWGCRARMILLDTAQPDAHGGTGQTFDWNAVPDSPLPIMVAGGLDVHNVAEVVRAARPWGVDVSSGVESNGEKDGAKIRDFVRVAKAAAAARDRP